jgi:hypothetical protein
MGATLLLDSVLVAHARKQTHGRGRGRVARAANVRQRSPTRFARESLHPRQLWSPTVLKWLFVSGILEPKVPGRHVPNGVIHTALNFAKLCQGLSGILFADLARFDQDLNSGERCGPFVKPLRFNFGPSLSTLAIDPENF